LGPQALLALLASRDDLGPQALLVLLALGRLDPQACLDLEDPLGYMDSLDLRGPSDPLARQAVFATGRNIRRGSATWSAAQGCMDSLDPSDRLDLPDPQA